MRLIDADKLKVYRCDDSASRATFDYIDEDDVEDAPTIDLVKCKDCKHSKNCVYPAKWNWCPDGERRAEQSQINTIENTNDKQSEEAIKEIVKDYITARRMIWE